MHVAFGHRWRVPDWLAITTVIAIAAAKAAKANLRTRRGAPARWRAIVRGPHSGAEPGCMRIHAPGRASTAVITRQRSDFERGCCALGRRDEERVLVGALVGRRAVDRSGRTARESSLLVLRGSLIGWEAPGEHFCWDEERPRDALRRVGPGSRRVRAASAPCGS